MVLGVSPDLVKAVDDFDQEYGLGFPLLADTSHEVAERYGVRGEKSMYGRTFWGVQRTMYIVGPDGKVAHVIPKVRPKTHDDEVLAALAELSAA